MNRDEKIIKAYQKRVKEGKETFFQWIPPTLMIKFMQDGWNISTERDDRGNITIKIRNRKEGKRHES